MSAAPSLGVTLAAAMAVQLFVMVAITAPSVLGPAATADLGVAPQTIGLFYGAQNLGSVFGCLALAGLVRRYGGIRGSQIGALTIALASAACASALLPVIALASFVVGIGMSLITPSSAVMLARAAPPARMNLVFSFKQSIVPVGVAAGGLIVPWLLEVGGWRQALVAIAASSLAFVLAIQPLRASMDVERNGAAPLVQWNLLEPLRVAFAIPALRYVALGGFIFNGTQQLFWIYIVTYMNLELGYSIAAAGAVFAAGQVTAVVGRIFWGWVADRLRDPFLVLTILAAGSCVFFVAFAMLRGDWPLWLAVAVSMGLSGTIAAWNGVHVAAIVRHAPRERLAVVAGAVQVFAFLGAVVAPAAFAAVVSASGRYSVAYLVSSLLPLVFFAMLASPARRRRLNAGEPPMAAA